MQNLEIKFFNAFFDLIKKDLKSFLIFDTRFTTNECKKESLLGLCIINYQ